VKWLNQKNNQLSTKYGARGEKGMFGVGAGNIFKTTNEDADRMVLANQLLAEGRANGIEAELRGAHNCDELVEIGVREGKEEGKNVEFGEAGPHAVMLMGLKEGEHPATLREAGKDVKIGDPFLKAAGRGPTFPREMAAATTEMGKEGKRIKYVKKVEIGGHTVSMSKVTNANNPEWQNLVLDSPLKVRKLS